MEFRLSARARWITGVAALAASTVAAAGQGLSVSPVAGSAPDPAALIQQARQARKTSPDGAVPLATAAAEAARGAGRVDLEAEALTVLGESHAAAGRPARAAAAYRQALDRTRTLGRPVQTAEAMVRVSRTLVGLNQYEEAIQGYLEAVRLAESAGDTEYVAVVNDFLGITHYILRNYERALAMCRLAEPVLERSSDRARRFQNLTHLGIIYAGTERWTDALAYYTRAAALREQSGGATDLMGALGNVASALNGLKRHDEALSTLNRALAMAPEADNVTVVPLLQLRRARTYVALGRRADAARDFEAALRADRQLGDKRRLAGTLRAVAGFYRDVPGMERRAIEALEETAVLNQSVYDEDATARTQELQERFDTERRQRQIELLERDKALAQLEARRQRQVQWGVAAITVVLVAGLVFVVVRYRAEARTSRALRDAMQNVQTLRGLLPICAHCKKIRNDDGYWQQVETYIGQHSAARFSHGICPECMDMHYRDVHGGSGAVT